MDFDRSSSEQRIGSTLKGKYVLESLLGVGGMAAVYRGRHRNGNRVAVKILHPSLSVNADIRDRFLREGYVANKVEHRGAVRVLDDDLLEDGSVFLVMELLEGATVDAHWERRKRRLPPREVSEIAHQLLDVLAAAHEKGIVHRDIKPENLFLTTDGVVKVLDFGIARLRDPLGGGGASATRTGRMLGTPAYMPPEQVLGLSREVDAQTDLWSVGATMFTLVSGRYVHDAETVEALLVYAGSRRAPPLSSVAPDVPAALASVIDRALVFEKQGRWATARAMETGLERAYVQTFGAPIPGARRSRADSSSDAFAPTAYAPVGPAAVSGPNVAAEPSQPLLLPAVSPRAETWQPAPKAVQAKSAPPGSTTAGVVDEPVHVPRNSSRVLVTSLVAIVGVVLVGGIGTLWIGRSGDSSTSASSAPAAISMPVVPSVSLTPLPSSSAIAADASATSAADAGLVISVTELPKASTAPAVPAAPPHGATPRPPPPHQPPVQPTPQPPVAPKANCDPPFTIDASGRRIPKPECL